MTAKTGAPVRLGVRLDEVDADLEIHEPEPGTLLAVCGACGFTWDADQLCGDDTRQGHECLRCLFGRMVQVRQSVIEDAVRRGGLTLADTYRVDLTRLRAACLAAVMYLEMAYGGRPNAADTCRSLLRRALEHAGFGASPERFVRPSAVAVALSNLRGSADPDVVTLVAEFDRLIGGEQ